MQFVKFYYYTCGKTRQETIYYAHIVQHAWIGKLNSCKMCLIGGNSPIHEYQATSHKWATDRSISRDHVLGVDFSKLYCL
jgi:hypothetical protein